MGAKERNRERQQEELCIKTGKERRWNGLIHPKDVLNNTGRDEGRDTSKVRYSLVPPEHRHILKSVHR